MMKYQLFYYVMGSYNVDGLLLKRQGSGLELNECHF